MAYSISHSYFGESFVNDFNWFNGNDPSNGFVRYQNQPDALEQGLYSIDDTGVITLGVDSNNTYTLDEGRPSVRLESKRAYNHGLFIGDFSHMPPSICGVWPAFWMYGPDWPNNGEIDIIEGSNTATRNLISAHTSEGCTIPESGIETAGEAITYDCVRPGVNNAGCSFVPDSSDTATYGDTFNAVGGGVYAMEWTAEDIRIWHWPRQSIPADVVDKQPDPSSWGLPTALFGTSTCDPDTYFRNMSIVIQTNFCGDFAGSSWNSKDSCAALADTCSEHVANSPEAFENAYWEVNYVDVYERGVAGPTSSEELTTTTTVSTTKTVTHTVWPSNGTASTTGTPVPTGPHSPDSDSIVPGRDPASVGSHAFLGCFGSQSGFSTFDFASVGSDDMTPEVCVESCGGRRYAGVHDGECLCADELDGQTRALSDRRECDIPCPGNATEFCGGMLSDPSALLEARQQAANISAGYLVSLYGAVGGGSELPDLPPGEGGVDTGAGSHIVNEDGQADMGTADWDLITTTIHLPYVTVCPADAARLCTTEYRATYTLSQCDGCAGWANQIPEPFFRTTVQACNRCGPNGESEVTLTVPEEASSTPAPTPGGEGTAPPAAPTPGPSNGPTAGPTAGGMPGGPSGEPTGLVQVDEAPVLSMGVAIALPIVVAAWGAFW